MSEKPKTVDVEKVLQGLKCCDYDLPDCHECPYCGGRYCDSQLRHDTITVIDQLRSTSPCGQGGEGQETEY